jgi:two-component system, OmpR family, sensor kinase
MPVRLLPSSLRSRLAVLFAFGSALLLVVLVGLLYVVLDHELLAAVDRGLASRSDDLAVVAAGENGQLPNRDPFAQVLQLDGTVIDQAPGATRTQPALSVDQLAAVSGSTWFRADVADLGGASRLLARPIEVDGKQEILVVGSPLDAYIRARERLAVVLLVASPVLIGLLAGAGWVLAGAALRPVARLTDETAGIPVDELGRRLAVPASHDEIEQLARTINALLDRVERSVAHERRFIDDASHELRTPISILRGELELALARPDDHAEVVASLGSAFDEAARLGRLADDLLVLARSRASDSGMAPTLVDLRSVADHVADLLGPGTPISVQGSGSVPADADRVEQILLNLLTNARRHAAQLIEVRVTTAESGDTELAVADDGPGFAASMLPVTFARFVRSDPARSRDTGGTGLGLAIVAAQVRAQGASIVAANGPPLGGAVVRIVFAAPGAPRPVERPTAEV